MSNDIKAIDLFITEECNMRCTYCFHKQGPQVLTVEKGKQILDKLKELNPETMCVNFFGGEPLLYPDTVIQLAYYTRSLWPNSELKMSTNGTCGQEEVYAVLSSLKVNLQVSFDGDEITHNECRKGGDWNKIVSNIKLMLRYFPNLSCRLTYTPKTLGRLSIAIPFIHSLGITKIMHHAVMEAEWNDELAAMYRSQLRNLYHYRRRVKKLGGKIDIHFIDHPLAVLNDEVAPEKNFCDAGKSYIAILPNGDTYPCHRAASQGIFKLGNIFGDLPYVRGMFLGINKETAGCSKNCICARTCHNCIITNYLVNQDIGRPIDNFCKLNLVEYDEAQKYMQIEITDRMFIMMQQMGRVLLDIAEHLKVGEKDGNPN